MSEKYKSLFFPGSTFNSSANNVMAIAITASLKKTVRSSCKFFDFKMAYPILLFINPIWQILRRINSN